MIQNRKWWLEDNLEWAEKRTKIKDGKREKERKCIDLRGDQLLGIEVSTGQIVLKFFTPQDHKPLDFLLWK